MPDKKKVDINISATGGSVFVPSVGTIKTNGSDGINQWLSSADKAIAEAYLEALKKRK